LEQLENAFKKNPVADMLFFREGYFSHEKIKRVCEWARITINPSSQVIKIKMAKIGPLSSTAREKL